MEHMPEPTTPIDVDHMKINNFQNRMHLKGETRAIS